MKKHFYLCGSIVFMISLFSCINAVNFAFSEVPALSKIVWAIFVKRQEEPVRATGSFASKDLSKKPRESACEKFNNFIVEILKRLDS
jgi:hypothetical protein